MLGALVKKELLALSRDLHGLGALFLMPALFIVLMSLALQNAYSPNLASVRYAIDARDTGAPARLMVAAWQRLHGPAVALPADWKADLRSGRLDYVVSLHPGLSDVLDAPALPTEARVELLTEPGIDGNLFKSLRSELIGVAGEVKGQLAFVEAGGPPQAPNASIAALVKAERFASGGPRPTAVQQNVPAWLVFGMFFVVASLSSLFIQERDSGTLARLRSLGVSRSMLLASKALPYLGVNALQAALMLAVGVWVMPLLGSSGLTLAGIHWGALALVLLATGCAAVSLALVLACAVRTHGQAATVGPILNVLMAVIGGIMVPKFVMPAAMQRVAEWSPMNWGLEALLTVLLRNGGVAATLPEIGRLVLFALAMLLLAALLIRKPVA